MDFCIDFLKDLSVTIIGSLIGFGGALFIFLMTLKSDRKKQKDEETTLRNEKLAFFYFIVRKIYRIGKHHVGTFKEFADKAKQKPVNHHLLRSTPVYELTKFTTSNWEDQFTSYVSLIKKDDRVQHIFQIISSAEFICFLIEDALRIHREKMAELYKKKNEFKYYFQEIQEILLSPTIEEDLAPDICSTGQKGLEDYKGWRDPNEIDDVEVAQKWVISRLFNAFNSYTDFQNNLDRRNIKSRVLRCNSIFSDIVSHAEYTTNIFIQFSNSLEQGCKNLALGFSDIEQYLRKNGFSDLTLLEEKNEAQDNNTPA
ncbi:MAG TPA: hypothetical protein PLS00_00185 [Niabella sp.]|nr:hypothetical protein [Niabella sp.]